MPLLEYAPTPTPTHHPPPSPQKEEVDKKSIAYDFFNALSASHGMTWPFADDTHASNKRQPQISSHSQGSKNLISTHGA